MQPKSEDKQLVDEQKSIEEKKRVLRQQLIKMHLLCMNEFYR